jgi:DNA integrity scanning protein DisA with diadenylate cyclase activity
MIEYDSGEDSEGGGLRLADIADILVVSFLFYAGMHWLRRRAARAVAVALFLLALVYIFAHRLNMYLTLTVFQTGLTVLLLSLVIIFQQDIRRTFEHLSSWRGFQGARDRRDWSGVIDQLVETSSALAKQRIGALIVIRGLGSLEPFIEGGVQVKGKISIQLLMSIFHPATPGHDGAVVIDRNRLEMLGA